MIRRLVLVPVLLLVLASPAFAQSDRVVEIVRVEGIVDARKVDFVVDAIEAAGRSGNVEVVILQIDSPGFVGSPDDLARMIEVVSQPPLPLVAWLGPAPAVAYGGMLAVLAHAPLRLAAPGTMIGHANPAIAGTADGEDQDPVPVEELSGQFFSLVGGETASPRQVIQSLDGQVVAGVELRTIRPFTSEDTEGVTVLETVIREPGALDALLGLTVRPDVAFFLLVAGLALAAFEFYAIGPGIAAALAAICLAMAAHGLAVLPVRWWAVALALLSTFLLSVSYQRGRLPIIDAAAISLLLVAGFALGDAAPQFGTTIPGVVLSVVVVGFLFLVAMPTVARSRFSTPTIGRESLIGREGVAVTAVAPDGTVEIGGARWKAVGHRESGIEPGDGVRVVGIDGVFLSVEPNREKST